MKHLDHYMEPNNASGNQLAFPAPHGAQGFPGYGAFEQEEKGIDLLALLSYVLKYRWLIAAFLFTGLVVGIIFNFLQTPLYRSTAKVEIMTSGAKILQDLDVVSNAADTRAYETARLKILSRELAKRVAYELNLANDSKFLAPVSSFSLSNLISRALGTSGSAPLDSETADRRNEQAIDMVRNNTTATLVRNASIVQVSYSHPDPKYAQLVANQLVSSFIDMGIDTKIQTSSVARDFIAEQVNETKKRLEDSEQRLVEYARREGITLTGTDNSSLSAASLTELNSALSQAIQDRLSAERLVQQIDAGKAASLPAVFESASIQTTKEKLAELSATYQQKLQILKPGFPEMVSLSRQITEMRNQIGAEVSAIADSTRIKYDQAKEREAALKDELRKLESENADFQQKNIQYTILKREVDSNRAQYESLIKKLNDVGVGSELKSANALVVDTAVQPKSPYSPNLKLNIAGAMILFSLLGAAMISILELMNNTFSVPDQIEEHLKLPVLGILPFTKDEDIEEELQNPKSALSEAYRTLRTSLQFSTPGTELNSIAITSSEPSEGKSTTAMQLARDFASLGKRVLIIDADMRKPKMHRLMNVDNGLGLSNLLSNVVPSGSASSIFRKSRFPNVTFMSAGTIPPNPADLLMSQKMGLTLHLCKQKFDLVIIDCPPVIGLSDAPIITRQAEVTLLVVGANQTSRKSAQSALKRLKNAGANVVGVAFNKFSTKRLDYNYSYRYMNYNYYSYSEGAADKKRIAAPANNNKEDTNRGESTSGNGAAGAISGFIDSIARRFG